MERVLRKNYEQIRRNLVDPPFIVSGPVKKYYNSDILEDTGCTVMGAIDSKFVQRNKLA